MRHILEGLAELVSLEEIGYYEEIDETADTLEGNALIKARQVYEATGKATIADDTGLEVEQLGNSPGVYSARYAGTPVSSEANIDKLLHNLKQLPKPHKARFRTVIALVSETEERLFEGIVEGQILDERRGSEGFGYDSVFQATESDRSFAEMSEEEKNKISHRSRALAKLRQYICKES